jgi:hypothetical protein
MRMAILLQDRLEALQMRRTLSNDPAFTHRVHLVCFG